MRIAVIIILFGLVAACGGGGGGRVIPYNPPDANGQNGPSYNRSGSAYMPTVSGSALTYKIARSTTWGGIWGSEPVWHDTDDTTYVRDTADISGTSSLIMRAEPAREQRLACPVFEGTTLIGTYWLEGDVFHRFAESPLAILPPALPDVGGTWTVGAVFHYGETGPIHVIISLQGEILGLEDITVPAGTYEDALKVRYTGDVQIDNTVSDFSAQTFLSLPGSVTVWYVDGVGPVRGVASSTLTGEVEVVLKHVAN